MCKSAVTNTATIRKFEFIRTIFLRHPLYGERIMGIYFFVVFNS